MNDKKAVKPVSFLQLEEVLEERQNSDRRHRDADLPEDVGRDRRQGDRRHAVTTE